ncbi:GTP cyclohydrolase II RibA [Pseudarthrobacter sp. NIBRBAC000502772]|uniref:GTP cyclohydrolase II RibA n=1 Tax=Pseudarthrobacter sp. NIBRBAC000502772 TaxID=2590775 RepID=UPI0011306E6E|nr:GTP cyclohydrolase II RibA [Pseudarthrobacter sp. NIBRBAC000502772]QDG67302.1 GTP cyclohydrolase II RibA [Pseudarthrobacter sp. NIBRBAC000502772]
MTVMSETVARPFEQPAAVRSQVTVPLRFPDGFAATAEIMTFHGLADGKEHLLLALGEWEQTLLDQGPEGAAPLVRLHSECLTGDVFGSERCDCGPQLREAVEEIAAVGGFLLYLRQEGRGIGLYSKLDAYALQDTGLDTYEANVALGRGEDERDYSAAAQMLGALGAGRIRLLTNNPDKVGQLTALGVDVSEQVPTGVHLSEANHRYLAAKRSHTAHTIELPEEVLPAVMPTAAAVAVPTHDELLARVDALVPRLRERASETEEIRRIPDATMAELKAAGVFQMLAPKAVGGFGMGLETYVEVVRRLARGCVSTAWSVGHLVEHVWMLARWPREAQDEVFANGPAPLAAATGAPPGKAERAPGGFIISGRWSFASGVMHSEWALLAVQHGEIRLQCLVPVSDLDLLDVWHTAGLRGTGSNDLRTENLFVPAHRALEWNLLAAADNPGSRIHPDPNIHIPMATFLNMVAPAAALGAAEHAIEVFRDLMMVRKVKQTTQARQVDSPLAQARFSQAFGQVATARLHWQEAVRLVAASYGRRPVAFTDGERAQYRLSLGLSGGASAEAVRLILTGSGGSVHRLTHPLQRIQRDVNVLLNHASLTMDPILEQAGRGLLDLGFSIPAEQF